MDSPLTIFFKLMIKATTSPTYFSTLHTHMNLLVSIFLPVNTTKKLISRTQGLKLKKKYPNVKHKFKIQLKNCKISSFDSSFFSLFLLENLFFGSFQLIIRDKKINELQLNLSQQQPFFMVFFVLVFKFILSFYVFFFGPNFVWTKN